MSEKTLATDWIGLLKAKDPSLARRLGLHDLLQFAHLAAEVHHRYATALRLNSASDAVIPFLANALRLDITTDDYQMLWRLLYPYLAEIRVDPQRLIQQTGLHPSLASKLPEFFYAPPVDSCLVCHDQAEAQQPPRDRQDRQQNRADEHANFPLHRTGTLNGYLYDIDAVHTISIIKTQCPRCKTVYRPSFYTTKGLRYYYTQAQGRDLKVFHVHAHYFMSHKLAKNLHSLQMLAHVSHFNLVNTYNISHVDGEEIPVFHEGQTNTPRMSEVVCRDGLVLHSLLYHADRREESLEVDADGRDDIRFRGAMARHITLLESEPNPIENHFCSGCTRILPADEPDDEGNPQFKSLRACVVDGLTLGHWCCSASPEQLEAIHGAGTQKWCEEKLMRVSDRYCPEHTTALLECCVMQPCTRPTMRGAFTCDLPSHIDAMAAFEERKSQNFTIPSRMNRPGTKLPFDPTAHMEVESGEFIDYEALLEADEADREHEAGRDPGSQDTAATPRLVASRRKTHNIEIVTYTCGLIFAWATFYYSESPSAVKNFVERVFAKKGLPEVVFHDNACHLVSTIYKGSGDSEPWHDSIVPVDAFHMKSHKKTDAFCQNWTDPKLFPELRQDGSWYFNSSAGEVTNSWVAGFASMCRNMDATHYNFFLSEMFRLRNEWHLVKLNQRASTKFIGFAEL